MNDLNTDSCQPNQVGGLDRRTISDHMPLHLQILPPNIPNPKASFRFESLWLREAHCRNIMVECWSRTSGQSLMDRVGSCSKAIWIWGKHFARNFQRRLDFWRKRMEATKHRHDHHGVSLYSEAQAEYLRVLHHQSDYWRQRAKQFWLKDGDTNSNFFHRSVKRRQQANRIAQLKDNNGVWIERELTTKEILKYLLEQKITTAIPQKGVSGLLALKTKQLRKRLLCLWLPQSIITDSDKVFIGEFWQEIFRNTHIQMAAYNFT
nr:uncharacterized protein LOC109167502 [Ipomoea batatas]